MAKCDMNSLVAILNIFMICDEIIDSVSHASLAGAHTARIHRKPSALCLSFVRHLLLLGVRRADVVVIASRLVAKRERKIHPTLIRTKGDFELKLRA
jgi:hypothetical protein